MFNQDRHQVILQFNEAAQTFGNHIASARSPGSLFNPPAHVQVVTPV